MANKKHRKKKQGPVLPVIVGLALVLVAAAMLAGTNSRSEVAGAQAPRDPSVLPVAVQFAAPDLTLENINGQAQSLADYRRQVILVNNWATWCPPCKAEMPVLEAYFETYADQGFMIVAIEAGDAKDAVTEFALSNHLQFQVWLDPSHAALEAFGNGNLPNSYVIDRDGTVRYAWTGAVSRDVLERYITPLLSQQAHDG